MDLSAAAMRGVMGEIRSVGLWGNTPDGPAECSFGGYKRVALLDGQLNGEMATWPSAEFGPVSSLGGVAPVGWAFFDAQGLMVHRETTAMGAFRVRVKWRILPALRVKVVP